MSPRALYGRLSAFYFLYYAAVGTFVPYWPLYLLGAGFSAWHVGAAFAVLGLSRIAVPLAWARIMDRHGGRMAIIVPCMVVASVLFSAMLLVPAGAPMWLLLLHALYAIFWHAALPAFDVVTLHHIEGTRLDYSRIRLWGSVGFIVAVIGMGGLLEFTGYTAVPVVVCAFMIAMAVLGRWIPDVVDTGAARSGINGAPGLMRSLRQPAVMVVLFAAFASQLSFAPFYGFFSIYLQEHGYRSVATGQFWAFGVAAEVVVFWYAGRIITRFGARGVLLFALATTVLRWLLLAFFVESLAVLSLSQLLHLSSFGLYHTVTVYAVHRLFPGYLHGQGQALLAGVSFGLGGALGSLIAGHYWEAGGGELVFGIAAVAALIGFIAVLMTLPRTALQGVHLRICSQRHP